MITELALQQEERDRNRAELLAPARALYTTTSTNVPSPLPEPKPEASQPILCDECGKRAGAVGATLFCCPGCQVVIRVSPGVGRVEYTEAQWIERHGPIPIAVDGASSLEPLDPAIY